MEPIFISIIVILPLYHFISICYIRFLAIFSILPLVSNTLDARFAVQMATFCLNRIPKNILAPCTKIFAIQTFQVFFIKNVSRHFNCETRIKCSLLFNTIQRKWLIGQVDNVADRRLLTPYPPPPPSPILARAQVHLFACTSLLILTCFYAPYTVIDIGLEKRKTARKRREVLRLYTTNLYSKLVYEMIWIVRGFWLVYKCVFIAIWSTKMTWAMWLTVAPTCENLQYLLRVSSFSLLRLKIIILYKK